jgi:hypothetical protein
MPGPNGNPGYPIQWHEYGHNAHQEWGAWTTSGTAFIVSGGLHAFKDKGYYIVGDRTPESVAVNGFTGDYAGKSYGTIVETSGASSDLTGTFGCKVHIGSGPSDITDFNFHADGGGRFVQMSSGPGNFNTGTSQFQITSGTMNINGSAATAGNWRVSGGLNGPSGNSIGAAWSGMTSGARATGIVQGDKK